LGKRWVDTSAAATSIAKKPSFPAGSSESVYLITLMKLAGMAAGVFEYGISL
jgi:hypothetical protein